ILMYMSGGSYVGFVRILFDNSVMIWSDMVAAFCKENLFAGAWRRLLENSLCRQKSVAGSSGYSFWVQVTTR
ncbi:hypothetical protein, partial [Klebsiella michiganensis]|uniref:hypothetical protein n=1 Tax=Klebsiella michiganensis TaxID=1134687 RepID=UPI001CE24A19